MEYLIPIFFGVHNHTFPQNLQCSNVRLNLMGNQEDKGKPAAPKLFTRKMLCFGLNYLCENGKIKKESIISVEADASNNDDLVHKVYEPMGFEIIGPKKQQHYSSQQQQQQQPQSKQRNNNKQYLLRATVEKILSWCSSGYGEGQDEKSKL